jgi:hypothetical protein
VVAVLTAAAVEFNSSLHRTTAFEKNPSQRIEYQQKARACLMASMTSPSAPIWVPGIPDLNVLLAAFKQVCHSWALDFSLCFPMPGSAECGCV